MSADIPTLDFALKLLNFFGLVAIGVYTWWTNRDRATAAAIEGVRAAAQKAVTHQRNQLHHLEQRISKCEHEIEQRLRLQDLEDLWTHVTKLNRELGELSSRLTVFNTQLQQHQEFLMQSK